MRGVGPKAQQLRGTPLPTQSCQKNFEIEGSVSGTASCIRGSGEDNVVRAKYVYFMCNLYFVAKFLL